MRIKIKYLDCGGFSTIIDCYVPRIFCPFCREQVISFEEIKEVTPTELYELLNYNNDKIVLT